MIDLSIFNLIIILNRSMKKCLQVILFMTCADIAMAQGSREYIREAIEEWGSCRNVAVTLTGGDIALNWNNAYAYYGIPSDLAESLDELHEDGKYIDDVQLTEDGNWLILYGDNGFVWNGIPYSLEHKIREYNDEGEVVTSVTFNDCGDWIVISQEHISASTSEIYEWIEGGIKRYGQLWSAHLTDDGMVLCYERGYKYLGNVPDNLKEALFESELDVYRIKFLSDGTYFFSDMDGYYEYYM